jgi:hypothetical protein
MWFFHADGEIVDDFIYRRVSVDGLLALYVVATAVEVSSYWTVLVRPLDSSLVRLATR